MSKNEVVSFFVARALGGLDWALDRGVYQLGVLVARVRRFDSPDRMRRLRF